VALDGLTASPETRARFQQISGLTLNYISALRDIGTRQTEILGYFDDLDQVESKWKRGLTMLVNSPTFELLPNVRNVETLVNEAQSACKDARTATWRYFVLAEASQGQKIAIATDEAAQKLAFARRDATQKELADGIDKVLTLLPEYTAFLKSTTDAIDAQNQIQGERADPAETAARALLERAIATATRSGARRTHAHPRRAGRHASFARYGGVRLARRRTAGPQDRRGAEATRRRRQDGQNSIHQANRRDRRYRARG
jgi:hypothetical protein